MANFFTIAFDCCMIGMNIIPLITAIIGLFDNKKEYTEVNYFIYHKDDDWYLWKIKIWSSMLRKLKAIWKILISDQYKVYAYRFTRVPEDFEYMRADYAWYIFSDNTDAINKCIKDYNWK